MVVLGVVAEGHARRRRFLILHKKEFILFVFVNKHVEESYGYIQYEHIILKQ